MAPAGIRTFPDLQGRSIRTSLISILNDVTIRTENGKEYTMKAATPSATAKPDLKQEAKLDGKPTHAVFFFIQAKVTTP